MIIKEIENDLYIEEIEDFDLGQTLECGQCFRFEKLLDNEYIIVAMNKLLRVKQVQKNVILYNTSLSDYKNIWEKYFDFNNDYKKIKEWLLLKDNKLEDAITSKYGVRLLNQDFFEILITFIISQNKQIPHIKHIVNQLSEQYGSKIGEYNGKSYYSFPTVESLGKLSEVEFRELKVGFRAPYLVDACKKVIDGSVTNELIATKNNEDALKILLQIKGVGTKVAHCVMLFGLSRRDSFPIDVWIKRIMENIYYKKETSKEEIQTFAKEHFGEYGGYAQQYLFYYARDNKIIDYE
ncbi:DNA-3-methyladenine glycosylase family protein [Anaeromicropila herbilytica]|uniref:DNA-(apurinic or apyrimidinic site) lyase n=1 Tax=Anaeromicropila herbilytica TaxID=2785025 RepID=A0A7R7EP16_9FIRM|nr:DNA glycosylase [Anaeromicropila herbilytica]BCN32337.1 8-oxoguanine DNA glycosylase [Anaeromicropila herbilytica]